MENNKIIDGYRAFCGIYPTDREESFDTAHEAVKWLGDKFRRPFMPTFRNI